MKPLSAAADEVASKSERHRRWEWCRLWNGFVDLPIWRVVAQRSGLPLYAVQAFVIRLDAFANAAEPRGWVGHFSADEFGVALGMSTEEAARLFAALGDPQVGWVDQEHVATFWRRNPDFEDGTVNERKQRSRAREKVRKLLADLVRTGRVSDVDRNAVLVGLEDLSDPDLFALRSNLAGGKLLLSTTARSHVTSRDIVTVTARADHIKSTEAVDNSGAATSGESAGSAEDQIATDDAQSTEAELWLRTEGLRIIVERMGVQPPRGETLLERWRRDLSDDPVAVAQVIQGCDQQQGLNPAQFHIMVTKGVERCRQAKVNGEPLPLGPVRNFGTDPVRPVSHVTAPTVDNAAPPESQPAAPRSGTDG